MQFAPLIAAAATPVSLIMQGQAQGSQLDAQAQQSKINAEVAGTRAAQSDTASRLGLDQELSAIRAAFAANGARAGVGNLEVMGDVRDARNRERRITTGAERQRQHDFRFQSRIDRGAARSARFGGFLKAIPSLVDLTSGMGTP